MPVFGKLLELFTEGPRLLDNSLEDHDQIGHFSEGAFLLSELSGCRSFLKPRDAAASPENEMRK